jgi:cardiolipin synthase
MIEHPDRFTANLFSPIRTEGNHTELYIDGPACLEMLLREIKKAQHYIHIQIMLFYSDKAGFTIARALAEKAKEGVEVRVMSDSDMSFVVRLLEKYRSSGTSNFSDIKKIFLETGVKFVASDKESYKMYNWDEERAKLRDKGVPEEFLLMQDVIQQGIHLNANTLDHRKILVFDGESAVVTGMNIGNKYLYDEQHWQETKNKGELWHTGAVLIKGPCVEILNKQFASKWMVRGGDVFDYPKRYNSSPHAGSDVCTVYHFFPGMSKNPIREYYLQKLRESKGPFIIENAYINDDVFWQALADLEEEQAKKIVLINPYKAKGNDFLQNESAVKCRMWEPFRKGVNFYSYRNRMTHWKIALDVANAEVFFGSYNLNNRSSRLDFELNVLIESPQLAEKVKAMLAQDIEESHQVTDMHEFYQHPNRHPSCLLLEATEFFE